MESIYHKCLKKEIHLRKISLESELWVPVNYKGLSMDAELRCDFFVENILVLEIKAIENLPPIHEAQILSYMKLLNVPIGLLINFHSVNIFKEGQRTFVNELYRELPE